MIGAQEESLALLSVPEVLPPGGWRLWEAYGSQGLAEEIARFLASQQPGAQRLRKGAEPRASFKVMAL